MNKDSKKTKARQNNMAPSHFHADNNTGNIKIAFLLNISFTFLEIIGGLWTNSLAILSDALHDLGDSFSLGMSWVLEKHSEKKPDKKYSYGYRRFSLLAAMLNTIVLIAGSLFILSEAIPRIIQPEHSNAEGMLLLAIVGILVNGLAVLRVRKGKSLNAQVVSWHLLEDVLGWIAVLIVSIVLLVKDIHILDPILSVLITFYVLYNVFRNLRKTFSLFLQAVPKDVDIRQIEEQVLQINMVKAVHHTHVWSLDGERHVLTTHVVLEKETTKSKTLEIKERIKTLFNVQNYEHVTIEFEYEDSDCSLNCE